MADDEVMRIAVLGSGPIGLEAALYGRYLGFEVTLLDEIDVCVALGSVDTRLLSAFRDYCTPLGLAALDAQNAEYRSPAGDQELTVAEWIGQYCVPLSKTDLVRVALQIGKVPASIEFDADEETYQIVCDGVNADQAAGEDAEADGPLVVDYVIDTRAACLQDRQSEREFAAAATDDFLVITHGTEFDFRAAVERICDAEGL